MFAGSLHHYSVSVLSAVCIIWIKFFSSVCWVNSVCVWEIHYSPICSNLLCTGKLLLVQNFPFFFFFFVEVNLCVLKQLSLVLSLFVWRFLCVLLFSLWIQYFCGYNYFFVLIPMLFLFEVTNLCALTVFILRYIPGWRSQQFYFLVDLFRLF